MKICLLTNNFNPDNGGGRFALEYAQHLRKQDPDADIIVLTRVPAKAEHVRAILHSSRARLLVSIPRIRTILKQCDVVHAFDTFPYGVIAAVATLGLDKKLVITALGSGSIRPLQTFWSRCLANWTCRRADAFTAISNYTAREIRKKLPHIDVETIPLGTNLDYFKRQTSADGNNVARARVEGLKPFILSVGKLKRRKGYHVSIEVYRRVLTKFPDLDYVIIGRGDGKYFETLTELTASLELSKRVHFLRDVSDEELVKFYENAEVFVLLPQNNEYDVEGFGLVFLEAAAFSLPVVGTRDSGAEEAVIDGKNGYLVPPDDVELASKKIVRILEDRDLNRRLRDASLAFAKRMTWDAVAEKYQSLYGSL